MLAALLTIYIVALVFTLALCRAAGQADEKERQWIEQRRKEEKELWKYCDDECLHCEIKNRCDKSEAKEG
jgi:hypothetical protein